MQEVGLLRCGCRGCLAEAEAALVERERGFVLAKGAARVR